MPPSFQPLPDDEPPLTLPDFLRRLANEPEFAEKMRRHYEGMLAVPLSPETEEMHKGARAALAALKHQQGALHARQKLKELDGWVQRNGTNPSSEAYAEFEKLVDEARDDLLDVSEPHRTSLMERIAGVQDTLRKLRAAE
jgi:hypothetical protein